MNKVGSLLCIIGSFFLFYYTESNIKNGSLIVGGRGSGSPYNVIREGHPDFWRYAGYEFGLSLFLFAVGCIVFLIEDNDIMKTNNQNFVYRFIIVGLTALFFWTSGLIGDYLLPKIYR